MADHSFCHARYATCEGTRISFGTHPSAENKAMDTLFCVPQIADAPKGRVIVLQAGLGIAGLTAVVSVFVAMDGCWVSRKW